MSKKSVLPLIISASVFALIAILTVFGQLDALNKFLSDSAQSLETPALTNVMKIVSNISEWFVYIPIVLILLIIPKLRRKAGIPVAVTLAVSAALNSILKQLFAIPRPDTYRMIAITGFGFPSGHAMNGTAFIGICALRFIRFSNKRRCKIIVSILAILFMLTVGFSRVYLGVHSPADVAAGYAMGLFLCIVINSTKLSKNI